MIKEKSQGYKSIINNPKFTNAKKRFCPDCKNRLEVIRVSKVINSQSKEVKQYNFSDGEQSLIGNVKIKWREFYCPNCNKYTSVADMMAKERLNKPIRRFRKRKKVRP